MNKNPQIKTSIFSDIKSEMRNVVWPTRKQALKLTTTVLIISLIVGLYIGIIDVVFAKLLEILTKVRK